MGRELLGLGLAEPGFEDVGHAGEAEFAERAIEFDEIHVGISWSCAIDEIAVEGELANERIDLAERQRARRDGVRDSGGGSDRSARRARARPWRGVVDDGRAVLLGQREDAEDAADAGGAVAAGGSASQTAPMCAPGAAWPGPGAPAWSAACARARSASCDAMPAPRRAQMLAQQLARLRVEQADVEVVPLHLRRAGRSSRAARRSTRPRLRRSRRDGPCGRRSGSSETARAGAGRSAGRSSANIAATWRFVVPWMRVSAQRVSQRSR